MDTQAFPAGFDLLDLEIHSPRSINLATVLQFIMSIDLNTSQLKLSFLLEGKVTIIHKIL